MPSPAAARKPHHAATHKSPRIRLSGRNLMVNACENESLEPELSRFPLDSHHRPAASSIHSQTPGDHCALSIMKRFIRDFAPTFSLTAVSCLLLSLTPTHAQLPGLKTVLDTASPKKTEPTEKPLDLKARSEQWLQDARETLTRIEAATTPADISAGEAENRRHDLEQTIILLNRALKSSNNTADSTKKLETSRAEDAGWTGFKEKPPYSMLMVDELLNERDATKANLTSLEAALANFGNLMNDALGESKAIESAVSNAILAVKNADPKTAETAKWRLDAAREKSRLQAIRSNQLQENCDSLKNRLEATRIDLSLIERKVATASQQCELSAADIEKVNKIANERKTALRKEIEGLSKRLKTAGTARNEAQTAVTTLASQSTDPTKPAAGLEMAKFRLEVAEDRLDTIQSLIEGIEYIIMMEDWNCKLYQDRQNLITANSPAIRAESLKAISLTYDRLRALENVLENQFESTGAELNKLESRALSITTEDPKSSLVNDQRTAVSEKLNMLERLLKSASSERKLAKRWVNEYSPKDNDRKWSEHMASFGKTAIQTARKIWAFELMSFEDKVELNGQTITGKIPVTLGTLLRALLFFVIGYWLLARVANRIQHGMVHHGHVAEAQAKTLRNWGMIVAGFFLVIGTFSFLKIPLTVFAFFGGALAIGIGFGTQTLIKNFISGIILLAERKVRVGDLLEVDGFIGRVTEINTRSSVIRSADDTETMVPNSLFLENRVTNWTLDSAKVRRTLQVGVAYGSPVQQVMEALTESAHRHGLVCKDPAPFAVFEDFGDSALMFRLYYWLELRGATNGIIVASDIRQMIEKRFSDLKISVPFPQRDLRLSSDQPLKVEWSQPSQPTAEP